MWLDTRNVYRKLRVIYHPLRDDLTLDLDMSSSHEYRLITNASARPWNVYPYALCTLFAFVTDTHPAGSNDVVSPRYRIGKRKAAQMPDVFRNYRRDFHRLSDFFSTKTSNYMDPFLKRLNMKRFWRKLSLKSDKSIISSNDFTQSILLKNSTSRYWLIQYCYNIQI